MGDEEFAGDEPGEERLIGRGFTQRRKENSKFKMQNAKLEVPNFTFCIIPFAPLLSLRLCMKSFALENGRMSNLFQTASYQYLKFPGEIVTGFVLGNNDRYYVKQVAHKLNEVHQDQFVFRNW